MKLSQEPRIKRLQVLREAHEDIAHELRASASHGGPLDGAWSSAGRFGSLEDQRLYRDTIRQAIQVHKIAATNLAAQIKKGKKP